MGVGEDGVVRQRWLTITVAILVAGFFAWQLADPAVVTHLQRDPTGLHDPWRVLRPLLVQTRGVGQGGDYGGGWLVFDAIVEVLCGRWRWLVLFLSAGVVGQLLGYAWNPPGGGGCSVAVCGLVGAVIAAMLRGRPGLPAVAILLTPYYPVLLLGYDVAG